ncbi:polysaccharide biosynthesis/export family protein [Aliamphritea ceti]|uniref:polysaccharide biosynthesis/export family protein n=1 Tax=Aliamphritea ceti TaxID=1524258 RepID=UPI0021C27724|nr:polysaccharide biosynthesis/export family protein [Aliamphritea ceti]
MRSLLSLFSFVFVLLFSIQSAIAEDLSNYRIGSGDLLSIQVYGEEELSMEIRLSDAGSIAYPFLGELNALGNTIGELTSTIKTGLADGYLINPTVSITVAEYREFFINGEVEEPGGYPYQPGLTLQKAVAIAGGFTERASKSKLFIAREDQNGDPSRVKLNTSIQPGDIITIEESFF